MRERGDGLLFSKTKKGGTGPENRHPPQEERADEVEKIKRTQGGIKKGFIVCHSAREKGV